MLPSNARTLFLTHATSCPSLIAYVIGGHERIAQLLLENGAAMWMEDCFGFTAQQVSNRFGYKELGVLFNNWAKAHPDCMAVPAAE